MTTPKSPNGYTPYQQYSFPKWVLFSTMVSLLTVAGVIIFAEGTVLYSKSSIELVVGAGIAIAATLFIHESLHYLAGSVLGYNPVYVWPNFVYVPEKTLNMWEANIILLVPQLLSIVYAVLLINGLNSSLEMVVGWGLVLNLGGAASDVSWVIRRLTWPEGTEVTVGEDRENYVAFPDESG